MMAGGRWQDLGERMGAGTMVAVIGLALVWLGGWAFAALIVAATGVMVWELVRMLDPAAPAVWLATGLAAALALGLLLPVGFALPLILLPVFAGLPFLEQRRTTFSLFGVMILAAGFGLFVLRSEYGLVWMLWLALVVIATDVFGYFVGRAVGGPRLWPRVSPKKTWSGTVAGWAGAALVGLGFVVAGIASIEIVGVSVAISMAAQIGDIAESAVKRRAGVKDSSSLLPGHGGLFDRFDGMLGASVFLLLTAKIIAFPEGVLAG